LITLKKMKSMFPSDSVVPRRKRAGCTLVVFGAVNCRKTYLLSNVKY